MDRKAPEWFGDGAPSRAMTRKTGAARGTLAETLALSEKARR
jgi:hypothetical protein